MKTPPISPTDYQRIFRTIYSVLSTQTEDLTVCCHYFNFYAAAILFEHYNLRPITYIGVAAYRAHPEPHPVYAFFSIKDNKIDLDAKSNHCWINVDGWHLDFTAPLFSELAAKSKLPDCKRKRFMKPLSEGKHHPDELKVPGDFFALPNLERTLDTNDHYQKDQTFMALLEVCCEWFKKPPAKMRELIPLPSSAGGFRHIGLSRIVIEGEW